MKRLFWLGLGLAAGALAVRALTRRAQSFTPRGIAAGVQQSAGNMLDSVRDFLDDVREGMAEREAEIQAAFVEGVTFEDRDLYLGDEFRPPDNDHDHDHDHDHQSRDYPEGTHH
jgi:hypothetical protein